MASRNSRESVVAVKAREVPPQSFVEQFVFDVFKELSAVSILCAAWQQNGKLSFVRFEPGFFYRDSVLSYTHCVEENGANGKQYLVTVEHELGALTVRIAYVDPVTGRQFRRVFAGSQHPFRVTETTQLCPETVSAIPQLDVQHALEVVLTKLQKTPNKAVLTR